LSVEHPAAEDLEHLFRDLFLSYISLQGAQFLEMFSSTEIPDIVSADRDADDHECYGPGDLASRPFI
jgi:hypothetical protein